MGLDKFLDRCIIRKATIRKESVWSKAIGKAAEGWRSRIPLRRGKLRFCGSQVVDGMMSMDLFEIPARVLGQTVRIKDQGEVR